jgi:hypothetical protein
MLEPAVTRYQGNQLRCFFRGDAAFALPNIYEFLEAVGFGYAICRPAGQWIAISAALSIYDRGIRKSGMTSVRILYALKSFSGPSGSVLILFKHVSMLHATGNPGLIDASGMIRKWQVDFVLVHTLAFDAASSVGRQIEIEARFLL